VQGLDGVSVLTAPRVVVAPPAGWILRASVRLVADCGLRGRDAVHAATALAAGFHLIVSCDEDFDAVPGLTRVDPPHLASNAALLASVVGGLAGRPAVIHRQATFEERIRAVSVILAIGAEAARKGCVVHGESRCVLSRYAAGLALVAVLAAAGCTQEHGTGTATGSTVPSANPTTSTVATTSTSAPVPTTTSEADLAKAAAQRYVEAFNRALQSRDTTELRKNFVPGCIVCTQDADQIDGYLKSGRKVEGGLLSFTDVQVESVQGDAIILKGRMALTAVVIRDASGKVVESHPEFINPRRTLIRHVNGTWLLEGVYP